METFLPIQDSALDVEIRPLGVKPFEETPACCDTRAGFPTLQMEETHEGIGLRRT